MILIKGDGKRVIRRQDELGVALSPVLWEQRESVCQSRSFLSDDSEVLTLMTAMLTGAEQVASYFVAILVMWDMKQAEAAGIHPDLPESQPTHPPSWTGVVPPYRRVLPCSLQRPSQ